MTDSDQQAAPDASSSFRDSLFRAGVLGTVTAATALYAMAVTIANVALPQMQGAMAATTDQIAWVVTFNIVATAVATPMTGWLAARFGQRRVMVYGVLGFTVATFFCGIANNLPELVAYRIVQGLCGAPLVPLSQAIVLDVYPKRLHGMATSFFGIGVVLGPIFAPSLGGYLSEIYSWRWVFFVVVPFGIMSFIGVWVFVREGSKQAGGNLDWSGFLALSIAIASFQLMLDRGERQDWFESTEILFEAAIAATAFYIFVVHSLTAKAPFLNPRLMLDRNFSIGLLLTLIFGMLNFTPMVLLPSMLKGLQGYPDSVIGLLLAVRGAGTLLGFIIMLFGNRLDPRIWLVIGFSLQAIAGWGMAQFDINATTWDVIWTSVLQGLGVGLLWVPLTLITFATLEARYLAEGTAVFHLLRNIGSSIHISISIALVIRSTQVNYSDLSEFVSPFNEALKYPWARGLWSMENTAGLAALSTEIQRQSTMIGYINAFYFYAATAAFVLPLVFLVRWRRQTA